MNSTRRAFLQQAAALAVFGAQRNARGLQLADTDGVGLAELIRRKQITPLELVEDTIRRIERVNPKLNAVLTRHFDVEQARARAKRPLGDGPLAGVPILLKNLVEYKDADIDFGSRFFSRLIAQHGRLHKVNSPFTDALEQAGLIVTGVTNAPEFGLIETTEPALHGASRNPWNPEYTTGGSSGGSAAAVAAGIVPIAHANDGGGSIRIPACQCGVFGLKPTRKRELTPFTVGGMANDVAGINSDLCVSRSVRDLAAYLNIVENKNNDKLPPVGFIAGPSPKRLKIALALDGINGRKADPEVEQTQRRRSPAPDPG
jgi:amidase